MTTEPKKETGVVAVQTNITEQVLNKVKQFTSLGSLKLPPDYSAENALKSAWLILQEVVDRDKKPVLSSCSRESIANALLNMVVQGLSPMKKQCDFIAYGGKLTLQREYHGTIALAKRYGNVKDVHANVIYQGDVFEYTVDPITGRKHVVKHEQKIENIDNSKIIGAYAVVVYNDGTDEMTPMTMAQIKAAWNQGQTKGASPAHTNFPDEMAKKTVINRACKLIISSSDDSALVSESDDGSEHDHPVESMREEVSEHANRQELVMEDITAEVVESTTPDKDTQEAAPELEMMAEPAAPATGGRTRQTSPSYPGF